VYVSLVGFVLVSCFQGRAGTMAETGGGAQRRRHHDGGPALEDIVGVIGGLYDAAISDERWRDALAAMALALGASAAVLKLGASKSAAAVIASVGLEPASILALGAADPEQDPLCAAAERSLGQPVASGAEVGDDQLAASELGQLVLAPAALGQVLGAGLALGDETYAAAWFFRPTGAPFGAAERGLLTAWLPHLRRALEIQHRLAVAANHHLASSQMLDRLSLGAIVVDEDSHPLIVNRVAERILRKSDGLSSSPAGLCGSTAATTARLRAAVRETVHAAAGGHIRSVGLQIERAANARPFGAIVVSLRRSGRRRRRQPAAIVFIADPARTQITPERLLRELYGLTPAEARLAMALSHGKTLTDTAASLGIARNTAHSQLGSIFAKTGTSTQAELVHLLHRGPSAIRPYEDSAEFQAVGRD
jgi:DNA-binding CsgD family transcriptional regulator